MPLIDPRTGVVRHEKARASEGFTLFTTLGKTTTRLIDMDGEVVQEALQKLFARQRLLAGLLPSRILFPTTARHILHVDECHGPLGLHELAV